jgi:hypothetical protein
MTAAQKNPQVLQFPQPKKVATPTPAERVVTPVAQPQPRPIPIPRAAPAPTDLPDMEIPTFIRRQMD